MGGSQKPNPHQRALKYGRNYQALIKNVKKETVFIMYDCALLFAMDLTCLILCMDWARATLQRVSIYSPAVTNIWKRVV